MSAENPQFGVSTKCFAEQGPGAVKEYLVPGRIADLEAALQVAKALGIGLELVYRRFAPQTAQIIKETRVPVHQILSTFRFPDEN